MEKLKEKEKKEKRRYFYIKGGERDKKKAVSMCSSHVSPKTKEI